MFSRISIVLLLVFLTMGCSVESTSGSGSYSKTTIDASDGIDVTIHGVVISSKLPYVQVSEVGPGFERQETTIDGHDFAIEDGIFLLGGKRYGAVKAGDEVVVDKEGVSINGTRIGPLPQ